MALALLTSLKALDVSGNKIRLVEGDIELLAALADLRTFAVGRLSKDGMNLLRSFSARFPRVEVL